MLIDPFNRIISYIRISVTDRCNLRCRYCVDGSFPFVPHEEILKYEEIVRFVRIAAQLGVTKVRLTGGEPLARKNIVSLFRDLAATEGIRDISLTTNGVFLGDKIEELKEAGLKRVNISLDTLKRDRFAYITGVDAFDQVIASIMKTISLGIDPIKINVVVIRGFNDDEVADFADIAKKFGVDVRFIEFMPFGDSDLWDSTKTVPSEELERLIREHHALLPSTQSSGGPARMFRFDEGKGRIGFISPVSSHICSECNRIRLTADGKIRPCLFSNIHYSIKDLLRSNASEAEIRERIIQIVMEKPEKKRETGYVRKCQLSMRNIGG